VLKQAPAEDYYAAIRGKSDREIRQLNSRFGPVIERPMDKADHYVKRCVAAAGDTLEIVDGQIYINSEPQTVWDGVQQSYTVATMGQPLSASTFSKLGLSVYYSEIYDQRTSSYPFLPLTAAMVEEIKKDPLVIAESVKANIDEYHPDLALEIFPFDSRYRWTRDNYGPIWIPKKGETVELTEENLPLYRRLISVYEKNKLEVKDDEIFINGEKAQSYTFKQDYYFMMGDNRHNSLDSRYWGFVPEDHVVGKPAMIWLSINNEKSFPQNIRWDRLFKFL
jgi:signal peptidase I